MSETATMTARAVRLSSRNVEALMTSLILPVMLMLMFVYLFGGAIHTGTGAPYVDYIVPGVILLCAGFGSATTAVSVSQDMSGGIVDRLRSLDVRPASILAGHVAASAVRTAASTVVVLGVALAVGFRPHADAAQWLAAAGLLAAFVLAVSALAAAIGLLASSPEAANGFTFVPMFAPYASSAFVPVSTMPSWIQGFARHQPVTPVIDALRALMLDRPVGNAPWVALAWCAGLLVVAVAASGPLFRRRSTRNR